MSQPQVRRLDSTRLSHEEGTVAQDALARKHIIKQLSRCHSFGDARRLRFWRLSPRVLCGLVRLSDLILLLAAAQITFRLLANTPGFSDTGGGFAIAALTAAYIAIAMLGWNGAYKLGALRNVRRQNTVIAGTLLAAATTNYACRSMLQETLVGPAPTLEVMLLAALFLLVARGALALCIARWMVNGRLVYRTAIIGLNEITRQLLTRLAADPASAVEIVGIYGDWPHGELAALPGMAVAGGIDDLIAESRRRRLDVIAVALPLHEVARIKDIVAQLGSVVADIYLVSDLPCALPIAADSEPFGGVVTLSISQQPIKDWLAVQKTAFDYVFALLLLLLLAPLLLCTAAAIRLESRGPVLFRQPRLGFNNQTFVMFKFRTMYHEMRDLLADRQTDRNDVRVTPLGRWLRRLSIDELPQLFNVLRGDMSLVGPRPHAPNTKAAGQLFGNVVAIYANRHKVKPGITGWAQVNGWRGETTTIEQIENRVAHDLYYIENWSLRLDIKIILLTLLRELVSKHAY